MGSAVLRMSTAHSINVLGGFEFGTRSSGSAEDKTFGRSFPATLGTGSANSIWGGGRMNTGLEAKRNVELTF